MFVGPIQMFVGPIQMFVGPIQMQMFKVNIQIRMQMHLEFYGGIQMLNIQMRIQMHLHLLTSLLSARALHLNRWIATAILGWVWLN